MGDADAFISKMEKNINRGCLNFAFDVYGDLGWWAFKRHRR